MHLQYRLLGIGCEGLDAAETIKNALGSMLLCKHAEKQLASAYESFPDRAQPSNIWMHSGGWGNAHAYWSCSNLIQYAAGT